MVDERENDFYLTFVVLSLSIKMFSPIILICIEKYLEMFYAILRIFDKLFKSNLNHDETKVATNLFFLIVTSIWVQRIIDKEKKK